MENPRKKLCPGAGLSAAVFFQKVHEDQVCHDVVLQGWGRKYPAHRIVLSFYSEYFQKKFTAYSGQMLQKDPGQILQKEQKMIVDLQAGDNVAQTGFEFSLCYLYCCEGLSLTMTNVFDVLDCALFFQIPLLIDDCFKFLLESLSTATLIATYRWADSHQGTLSDDLIQACKVFMAFRFPEKTEEWRDIFPNLESSFLKDVMSSKFLNVITEYRRYRLVGDVCDARQKMEITEEGGSQSSFQIAGLGKCSAAKAMKTRNKAKQNLLEEKHLERMLKRECIEYAYLSPDNLVHLWNYGHTPEEILSQSLCYREYLRSILSKQDGPPILKLSGRGAAYHQKLRHPFAVIWCLKVGKVLCEAFHCKLCHYAGSAWWISMTKDPCELQIERDMGTESYEDITLKDKRQSASVKISVEAYHQKGSGVGAFKKLEAPKLDERVVELQMKTPIVLCEALSKDELSKMNENDSITIVMTIGLNTTT